MKKMFLSLILTFSIIGVANATYVRMGTFSTGQEYVYAFYTVGIAPSPGQAGSYVNVSDNAGIININIRNAATGERFYCYMANSTNNNFADYKQIIKGMSEMTMLFVVRDGNQCTNIQTQNNSGNFRTRN